MALLTKYKELQEGQLVRETNSRKDLCIVRYITVDDLLLDKYPEKEYTLIRVTLLNKKGIPYADVTKLYNQLIKFKDFM